MTYQSAELLFGRCEGGGHILLSLGGTCTWAYKAGKEAEITQRTKVDYYRCCARPTQIAVPSQYVAGESSPHKARGVSPSTEHGPWAAPLRAGVG